jgi:HEAT repeat protein/CHAT domain-containing protein
MAAEPESPTVAAACAALAAARTPDGPGIDLKAIKPAEAIPICEAAVRAVPEDGDLKAHLCRALQAAGRDEEAFDWCQQAAEAGSAAGKLDLGRMYLAGRGVERDVTGAFQWYVEAAGQGNADNLCLIGELLALLTNEDAEVRRAAAEALGQLGDPRAVEPLIALLEDEDSLVRTATTVALGNLVDPRAVKPLVVRLEDEDSKVRWAAVEALGEHDDRRTVEPLVARLEDEEWVIRRTAAEALGKLRDPRAVEPLLARLEDEDSDVRRAAIKALGEIGDPRAMKMLLARLKDEDDSVRSAAIGALGGLNNPHVVEPLLTCLADEDVSVRLAASKALGQLGDPRAVEPLVARLADQGSLGRGNTVSWAAVVALVRLGDPGAIAPLIARLEDEEPLVRWAAAETLGRLRDTRAVEPLVARLKDESDLVRQIAAIALVRIGDPRAVEPLVDRLKDEDSEVRVWAVRALGQLRDPRAVEPLVARLADEDSEVRVWAVRALGQLRDPRAVEPLAARLVDEDSELRDAVTEALGELGDRRQVEPLMARLEDEDSSVRLAAAEALSRLGNPFAVVPLMACLGDEHSNVRRRAANILGQLRDLRAVDPLVSLLGDEDGVVRAAAAEALGQLGDPRAMEPLMARLEDDHQYVRNAVPQALAHLDFSHPALTAEVIDRQARQLQPVLGLAPTYHANLLRLLHAASAYATPPRRNDLARLIWGWQETRAAGTRLDSLQADYAALAADTSHPYGPAADNPLVHLFLARLLLADLDAAPARLAAAQHHLDAAWTHSREDETVLRLMITWLRAEAALRQGQPAAAYELLSQTPALLHALRRPERELGLPLVSYTLALRSYAASQWASQAGGQTPPDCAYEERGQVVTDPCSQAAIRLAHQAEYWLIGKRDRFITWWDERLDDASQAEMTLMVTGFRSYAAKLEGQRGLDEARHLLESTQDLRLGWAVRQAERHLLEQMITFALETGAVAEAHAYAEQLALQRYRYASGPLPAPPPSTDPHQQQLGRLWQQQHAIQQVREDIARKEQELRQAEQAADAAQPEQARKREALKQTLEQLKKQTLRQAKEALLTLVRELQRTHPEIASLMGLSPLKLAQLPLGPRQALLQYVLLEDRGYLFVFRGQAEGDAPPRVLELPAGRAQLAPAIRRYRQLLQQGLPLARGLGDAPAPPASATELAAVQADLSQHLLSPLADDGLLTDVDQLLLVPNGPLHELPWASLAWEGGYLAQRFTLSQFPVAALVPALQDRGWSTRLWALGDPLPPEPRWDRLPGSAVEVTAIANHFPEQELYLAQDARRERLQAADLRGAVVHLAVHGEAGGPGHTHLVLSDGYLPDGEIYHLQVAGSPLVVLSACETGLGEHLSGDEVVSLANAFLLAGARSVVSTLWLVPDQGTQTLMTRFYAHLAADPAQGKAAALAQAQRELIAAGRPPADWAGVVVTGW